MHGSAPALDADAEHDHRARVHDVNQGEQPSGFEQADIELGAKIAAHREHPAVEAASIVSEIGDQGPLYAISAALVLGGAVARKPRIVSAGVLMCAAVGLSDLSKSGIKRLIRRTRPHVLLDEQRYNRDAGGSERKPEQSFPSGHTAGSIAAARALSRDFPEIGAAAGVAAVGIGISRVAKGAHWPLDILAGAVIGLAAETISTNLLRLISTSLLHLRADDENE